MFSMGDYKLSETCFLEQEWTRKSYQLVFSIIDPERILILK